jgi:CRP/FNR family transcriptional regulator
MLLADKDLHEIAPGVSGRRDGRVASDTVAARQTVIPHGHPVYTPGTPRDEAFRIEAGAVCHYVVWPDGAHDVIEFAFPGDIIGLGSLGEHVTTAQAMVDTTVTILSDEELEQALATDAALATRLSSATDREFDYLRRRALQPGPRPIPNRLAAYIIAVAGSACRSGETHLGADASGEEALAAVLELSVDDVHAGLNELKDRGLLAERAGALIIQDFKGLERLADA